MSKFKIGDKVRINALCTQYDWVGLTGVVENPKNPYGFVIIVADQDFKPYHMAGASMTFDECDLDLVTPQVSDDLINNLAKAVDALRQAGYAVEAAVTRPAFTTTL